MSVETCSSKLGKRVRQLQARCQLPPPLPSPPLPPPAVALHRAAVRAQAAHGPPPACCTCRQCFQQTLHFAPCAAGESQVTVEGITSGSNSISMTVKQVRRLLLSLGDATGHAVCKAPERTAFQRSANSAHSPMPSVCCTPVQCMCGRHASGRPAILPCILAAARAVHAAAVRPVHLHSGHKHVEHHQDQPGGQQQHNIRGANSARRDTESVQGAPTTRCS